ncbi:MAG: hypothetical protein ABSH11_03015 [Verrucomicrobiota bacterium]
MKHYIFTCLPLQFKDFYGNITTNHGRIRLDPGHNQWPQFNRGFRRWRFWLFGFGTTLLWLERFSGFHSQYRPRCRRIGNLVAVPKKRNIRRGFADGLNQLFPSRVFFIRADDLEHNQFFCIVTLLFKTVKCGRDSSIIARDNGNGITPGGLR